MNTSAVKKGARVSLVKVFSASLIGILFVFILLSYFTFTRLLSFELTLSNVSDQSLPDLIGISQLYSQASKLLESTELLSKSSSNASKRLAEKQLQANLLSIREAAKKIFDKLKINIKKHMTNLLGTARRPTVPPTTLMPLPAPLTTARLTNQLCLTCRTSQPSN